MSEHHYLDVQLNTENVTTRYDLSFGTTVVGSNETCHLVLRGGMVAVAPEHCEFRCTENSCEVRDLGTDVGTWVGDEQLVAQQWRVLQPGEIVSIGMYYLTYRLQETGADVADDPPMEDASAVFIAPIPSSETTVGDGKNGRFAPPPSSPPPPSYRPPFHHSYGDNIYSRYIQYLPGIYHDNPFTIRFLALLESILAPIEWNINNFDFYLDPDTAPVSFLPWLANWFGVRFDHTWTEARQREFLRHAASLQARRGTAVGLKHLLEIYTGETVAITETQTAAYTFRVSLPLSSTTPMRQQIIHLINSYKPAFTDYELSLTGSESARETS
ncbi:MAG: phage tail protein I [Anaerolineales bacterium]|nr:phage tail protein I [Anaerolineales bacterium]